MKQLLIYQIFSMSLHSEMTFGISIQDGTKLYNLQMKYPKKHPGRFVQNDNTRFCSAPDLYWLHMNKKLMKTEQCQEDTLIR